MSLPWNAYMRVLYLGDSKTDGTTTTTPPLTNKWYSAFHQRVCDKYQIGGRDTGAPFAIQSGVPSDTVASVNAALNLRAYPFSPDAIIVELTTNDITSGIINANYANDVATLLANLQNPVNYASLRAPQWILWVSPNVIGEDWPFGANGFDTSPPAVDVNHTIADKLPLLAAKCAAAGVTLWNPNPAAMAWEALHNPGHLISGLLTDAASGKHEIALGSQAMAGWMLDGTFQGAPASLPLTPLFQFFDVNGAPL